MWRRPLPLTKPPGEPILPCNPTENRRGCDCVRSAALAPTSAHRIALPGTLRPVVRVLPVGRQLAADVADARRGGVGAGYPPRNPGRAGLVANRAEPRFAIWDRHRPQFLVAVVL